MLIAVIIMLRIIGGNLRRRLLKVPGSGRIRPTSDKVRESLFNILGPELVTGSKFLDLFAGSGAVGIEALSRGSEFVTFIESDSSHGKIIRENLKTCDLIQHGKVYCGDVFSTLNNIPLNRKVYDIIFADPPYRFVNFDALLRKIITNVSIPDYGVMVIEHSTKVSLPEKVDDFAIYREYKYGDTTLSVYMKLKE